MHCVEHRTGGQEGADTTSHGHFYSHESKYVEETRDKDVAHNLLYEYQSFGKYFLIALEKIYLQHWVIDHFLASGCNSCYDL